VAILGGENLGGTLNSLDIFDNRSMQFYADVDVTMVRNRSHFCAVLLEDGRDLVAGGTTVADDPGTDDIEFSPDNGVEISNHEALELHVARMDHTCTLLQDGSVVIAGGMTYGGQATGLVEIVRNNGGVYSVEQLPDQLDQARFLHSASTMSNGSVLLSGGLPSLDPAAAAIRQSEIFVGPPICY